MKKGFLYVIIVVLIIGIVSGVTYLVLDSKKDDNIDIEALGKELFDKTTLNSYNAYYYFYEASTYEDMDNTMRLRIAFELMDASAKVKEDIQKDEDGFCFGFTDDDACHYLKIDNTDLETSYKAIFGEDKSIFYEEFWAMYDNGVYQCSMKEEDILCEPSAAGFTEAIGRYINYNHAVLNKDTIEIYVDYLGYEYDMGLEEGTVRICNDYSLKNVVLEQEYHTYQDIQDLGENIFKLYKDMAGEYKVIFKKDSTNHYYWYSTEYISK